MTEKKPYATWLNKRGRFNLPMSMLILVLGISIGMLLGVLSQGGSNNFMFVVIIVLAIGMVLYSLLLLAIERGILDVMFGVKGLQPMLIRRIIAFLLLDLIMVYLFSSNNDLARFSYWELYWHQHTNKRYWLGLYLPTIMYIVVATYVEYLARPIQKQADLLDDF